MLVLTISFFKQERRLYETEMAIILFQKLYLQKSIILPQSNVNYWSSISEFRCLPYF